MAKYMIFDGFFSEEPVAVWYMPINKEWEVEKESIKYRLKHDFNITIDHYSVCRMLDTHPTAPRKENK